MRIFEKYHTIQLKDAANSCDKTKILHIIMLNEMPGGGGELS